MTQHPDPRDRTEDEGQNKGQTPSGAPQDPYGQPTAPPQQPPGSGASPSGYGQQQGGYSAPGQPGPHPPGQGQPGPGGQQYAGQYSGEPYQQQPYPQQRYPQNSGAPNKNVIEGKNFFAALFDLSFQSFVTVKFAKFIYVLLIAFILLGYVVVVIASFAEDPLLGLLALLLGWIPAAIYLILIRITLEFMIALVRTSQNTAGTRSEIEALRSELKNRR